MIYYIGNAVHDENGRSRGGKPGDQLQTDIPDYNGEVRIQKFYKSSKGWNILRYKKDQYAIASKNLMILACSNENIGYSQSDRDSIRKYGVDSQFPCNCDCSSLVRQIVGEATGKNIPNFNTENEVEVLQKTGLFQPTITYTSKTTLYDGDIIVTKTKGHTAIITEGMPKTNPFTEPLTNVTSEAIAKKENLKKYISSGEGVQWVQYELCRVGYQEQIDHCGGLDGSCGKGTVECIKDFQNKKGLEVDGICGKKTRKALKET